MAKAQVQSLTQMSQRVATLQRTPTRFDRRKSVDGVSNGRQRRHRPFPLNDVLSDVDVGVRIRAIFSRHVTTFSDAAA